MGDQQHRSRRSRRATWAVLAASVMITATRTSAQDAAPATEPPAPSAEAPEAPAADAPEAASTPEAPPAQGAARIEPAAYVEARERVKRGEALFDAGNFDAALAEYEKAYELFVDHPLRAELLFNIALCHERSFRYTQAITYYRRYLAEAGPEGESRADVEAALRALSNLLATIEVQSNVRAKVWVDDTLVGDAPGVIMVPTGIHTIELRAPGFESEKREIRVTARESTSARFELAKIDEGLHPAWFYSALGATLATAIVGTGFAAKLANEHGELSDRDPARNRERDEQDLEKLALRADVFFATAGVLAVGTTLIALFTEFSTQDEAPARAALELGPTGMSIKGAF